MESQTDTPNTQQPLPEGFNPSIALVVAAAENNAIGKSNQLLWNLPNDLKFFKNTTWGFPVIMGRKTFESFNKALPGRTNIVITTKKDWQADNVIVVSDIAAAVKAAAATNSKQLFIIGGGEIYKQSMDIAGTIYITRVHAELDGDTFFPVIDNTIWELTSNQDFLPDTKHTYGYSFQIWHRKVITKA